MFSVQTHSDMTIGETKKKMRCPWWNRASNVYMSPISSKTEFYPGSYSPELTPLTDAACADDQKKPKELGRLFSLT
jgi:hypothetical protein